VPIKHIHPNGSNVNILDIDVVRQNVDHIFDFVRLSPSYYTLHPTRFYPHTSVANIDSFMPIIFPNSSVCFREFRGQYSFAFPPVIVV
jgi:hypothetical protein